MIWGCLGTVTPPSEGPFAGDPAAQVGTKPAGGAVQGLQRQPGGNLGSPKRIWASPARLCAQVAPWPVRLEPREQSPTEPGLEPSTPGTMLQSPGGHRASQTRPAQPKARLRDQHLPSLPLRQLVPIIHTVQSAVKSSFMLIGM